MAELIESIDVCVHRNIHNRTRAEIEKVRVLSSNALGVGT